MRYVSLRSLLFIGFTGLMATLPCSVLAQSGRLGESVRAESRVSANVHAILNVAGIEVTAVRATGTQTEVTSRVSVLANLDFQVSVRTGEAGALAAAPVMIQGEDGAWTALPPNTPVVVASARAGVRALDVRCRVEGGALNGASGCPLTYELAPINAYP